MPHKHRRPLSHQAADKQLDLFGLPGAKHSIPEFEWQPLPEGIHGCPVQVEFHWSAI